MWKNHPNFPYEVSSTGQVRRNSRILSLHRNRHGYRTVCICVEGQQKTIEVHRLVLETFVGPRHPDQVCRHLDGNPENNVLSNLQWGSHAENMEDASRKGRTSCVLTKEQAISIKQAIRVGQSVNSLARQYEVARSTIQNIRDGRTWNWL